VNPQRDLIWLSVGPASDKHLTLRRNVGGFQRCRSPVSSLPSGSVCALGLPACGMRAVPRRGGGCNILPLRRRGAGTGEHPQQRLGQPLHHRSRQRLRQRTGAGVAARARPIRTCHAAPAHMYIMLTRSAHDRPRPRGHQVGSASRSARLVRPHRARSAIRSPPYSRLPPAGIQESRFSTGHRPHHAGRHLQSSSCASVLCSLVAATLSTRRHSTRGRIATPPFRLVSVVTSLNAHNAHHHTPTSRAPWRESETTPISGRADPCTCHRHLATDGIPLECDPQPPLHRDSIASAGSPPYPPLRHRHRQLAGRAQRHRGPRGTQQAFIFDTTQN